MEAGSPGSPAAQQEPSEAERTEARDADAKQVTLLTRQFLEAWLSRRDFAKALEFFGASAFANQSMLREDCLALRSEGPETPEQIRRDVLWFLRNFATGWPAGRPLSEIVGTRLIEDIDSIGEEETEEREEALRAILNDVRSDRFMVVRAAGGEDLNAEKWEWLNEDLRKDLEGREFFVSAVPLRNVETGLDGVVSFVWLREGDAWKIYHAGVFCV